MIPGTAGRIRNANAALLLIATRWLVAGISRGRWGRVVLRDVLGLAVVVATLS